MRIAGTTLVSIGWAALFAPVSVALQAQSFVRPALRAPISGQITDGVPLYSTPATTGEGVLEEMASRAAVIFAGTVTGIKKPSDDAMRDSAAASVVEVDFIVERAVRGAAEGSLYAMREWAGMWRDSPRFTLGQRLLMLLHAPGPGGLSSPVDGLNGAIPVRGSGALAVTGAQGMTSLGSQASLADESAMSDTVDLRWLQAKTLKVQALADSPAAGPGVAVAGGLNGGAVAGTEPIAGTSQSTALDNPVQTPTSDGLARVLGLLASWQANGQVSGQAARSASN